MSDRLFTTAYMFCCRQELYVDLEFDFMNVYYVLFNK